MENFKQEESLKPLFKKKFPSLIPDSTLAQIWKFDSFDLKLFFFQICQFCIFHAFAIIIGRKKTLYKFWDGPNYLFVAQTLYKIPEENPWKSLGDNYPPKYFACHFPGFPLVIRFFSTIFFNNFWIGQFFAVIFDSYLFIFTFRRVLMVYKCVYDYKWTILISFFIPPHFIIYRCVGASEPLYLSYVNIAFICYKTSQKLPMLFALITAFLTRIEGLSIIGTIGLCYLIQLDIKNALFTSLSLISPILILLLHKWRFDDYFAYFRHNANLISFPFSNLIENLQNMNAIYYLTKSPEYSFYCQNADYLTLFYGILFLSTSLLYRKCLPIAIFCTVYFIYGTCLVHPDLDRYMIPNFVFSILIGMDSIWNLPFIRNHALILVILVLIPSSFLIVDKILYNCCSDIFMNWVMDPFSKNYKLKFDPKTNSTMIIDINVQNGTV